MNKIASFPGMAGMPDISQMADALGRISSTELADKQFGSFIKMTRSGDWVVGIEQADIEQDSLWAIHPGSIQHGYISWEEDAPKVAGEKMVPFFEEMPDIGDRNNAPGKPWENQMSVLMQCFSGGMEGQSYQYKGSSFGLLKAMAGLCKALEARMRTGRADIVPVVALRSESYKNKYGIIYNPILDIQHWVTLEGERVEAVEDKGTDTGANKRRR